MSADDSSADLAESWEVIAAFVEPFLEAWESGEGPPLIEDHLPVDERFRFEVLKELVKVDIDYRQQYEMGGNRLEAYADVFPELVVDGLLPSELILEEYQIRKASGESISAAEFYDRFPEQRSELEPILAVQDASVGDATVLRDGVSIPRHAEFVPGERIDDFYLMAKLGQGAFASVYLARQESMQRLVALKVSADKGSEAQTLAQLDHPNVVRVFDQSRLPDQGLRLLYMQYAPGGTLRALLARSSEAAKPDGQLVADTVRAAVSRAGVLAADDVFIRKDIATASWIELTCHYGIELAKALEYAHSQGVLHRDLKPANVLLDAVGSCKLADFNISFASEVEGQDAASSFGGSVAYMPPEQLAACHPMMSESPADVDSRSDVYALAVLLWEFATGTRPFDETNLDETWSSVLEEMIRRRSRAPTEGIWALADPSAEALREALLRCLHADPDRRVPSATTLAAQLHVARNRQIAFLSVSQNSGWRSWIGRWPIAAVAVSAILPNIPAALFAWFYNNESLQKSLSDPAAMEQFDRVQSVINGIAFPLGLGLSIWFVWPIAQMIRTSDSPRSNMDSVSRGRARLFRLAGFAAGLGVAEWTLAAIAYPVTLHLLLGGLPISDWGNFFFSHVLSGMIAAAYPFFLIAALTLEVFLPRWLANAGSRGDQPVTLTELDRLTDQMQWFLFVAGSVPAVGIFAVLLLPGGSDPHHEVALKALSVSGAVGFACLFRLFRVLQKDVDAYRQLLRDSET